MSSLAPLSPRPLPASCGEVFATPDGAAAGFVRAQLQGPTLWVQDRLSMVDAGRPWFAGWGGTVWTLRLSHPRDALIAAEEALPCRALSAVVVELHGNPAALSFTATRRLAVRAEASGVRLWLIRHAAQPDSSALRDRWRVSSLPSTPHADDPAAPGDPHWRAELFRSRDKRPGVWAVRHDAADRLHFTALPAAGTVAAPAGADGLRLAR